MKRKYYLDGLKGLACISVMLGHFLGIYKYAQDSTMITSKFFDICNTTCIRFFTSESFWLGLFFVVSGYLLTFSKFQNLTDVITKCINRIFRFVIPILGACFMILLIQQCIGFYNQKVQDIVLNPWLGSFYHSPLTLKMVLFEPINVLCYGINYFNAPYWVLKDMLLGAFIVYFYCFIKRYFKNDLQRYHLLFIIVLLILLYFLDQKIIFACLCGAFIGTYEDGIIHFIDKIKFNKIIYLTGVLMPLFLFYLYNNFNNLKWISYIIYIGFSIFIIFICKVNVLEKLLSSKICKFFGQISFGVYSFHWPIFSSIGLFMLRKYIHVCSNSILFIMIYLICIILTIILSFIFHKTVERLTSVFCSKFFVKKNEHSCKNSRQKTQTAI